MFFFTAMVIAAVSGSPTSARGNCEAPIAAYFEADWWSEQQMVDFDPNNPPPKRTRVRLNKWEYSDPIGVPHPDIAYLVVNTECRPGTFHVRANWIKRGRSRPLAVRAVGDKRYELRLAPYVSRAQPDLLKATISSGRRKPVVVTLPIVMGD